MLSDKCCRGEPEKVWGPKEKHGIGVGFEQAVGKKWPSAFARGRDGASDLGQLTAGGWNSGLRNRGDRAGQVLELRALACTRSGRSAPLNQAPHSSQEAWSETIFRNNWNEANNLGLVLPLTPTSRALRSLLWDIQVHCWAKDDHLSPIPVREPPRTIKTSCRLEKDVEPCFWLSWNHVGFTASGKSLGLLEYRIQSMIGFKLNWPKRNLTPFFFTKPLTSSPNAVTLAEVQSMKAGRHSHFLSVGFHNGEHIAKWRNRGTSKQKAVRCYGAVHPSSEQPMPTTCLWVGLDALVPPGLPSGFACPRKSDVAGEGIGREGKFEKGERQRVSQMRVAQIPVPTWAWNVTRFLKQ